MKRSIRVPPVTRYDIIARFMIYRFVCQLFFIPFLSLRISASLLPRFWVTHPCGQQWQTSYSSSGLSLKTPAPGIFFQPIFPSLARSPLSSSCRVGRWSWSGPLLTLGLHVKSLTNLGQRWRFAMERLAGFLPLIGFHWLLKGGLRMTGMWKMVCDPPQFLHLRPLAQSILQVPKAGDEFSSFWHNECKIQKSCFTKICSKRVCGRHNTMRGYAAQRANEGP